MLSINKSKLLKILDAAIAVYFYIYLSFFLTDCAFLNKYFGFSGIKISNLGGPTTGLLLLFLIRYGCDKNNFLGCPVANRLNKIIQAPAKRIVFFSICFVFIVLTALSIARHLSLSSGASDLGIFDQAIWNTTNGDILFSSLMGNMNLLGYHFYPILLLMVPFYKIWPNPIILLLIQSLLLSSAIIPLYLLSKNILKERLLIFAFIVSYVLSRPLRGVGLSDFHTECFILPVLFWAYYFLIKRKNGLLFTAIFVLFISKEDTVFMVSGLGLYAGFAQKRYRIGAALCFLGVLMWFTMTKLVIPYFNPAHNYPYMNRLPFGLTYSENLKMIIDNPGVVLKFFITQPKVEYCLKLFGPLGFMPLFSPPHYILIGIPLLKNLLPEANFSGFYNITSHYTASIIPFIYISAIYGAAWLCDKIRNKKAASLWVASFIIISSLFFYGKTDASKFAKFLGTIIDKHTLEKISYLKIVPNGASVAANFNLVPHLSQRKYIYEWNPQSKSSYLAEYVVVDLSSLDYLAKPAIDMAGPYFDNIHTYGYKKIFENKDKTFLIFHKQNFDQKALENL